jgi:GntR family transcriptional regulator, histidine utilization repressor
MNGPLKAKGQASVGYRDVRDEVLRRIRSGHWKPGALVPGEIELAQEFEVARATAHRAMRELVDLGYLERKRKGGTRVRPSPLRSARFVIPLIRQEIEQSGSAYGYRLAGRDEIVADVNIREQLGLAGGAKVLHLLCLHLAGDVPYQVEERWINLQTLPEALEHDFSTKGPNEWLVERVPFTEVELSFAAVLPPKHIALLLGMPSSAPGLLSERTTWLQGRSVTHVQLYFPQDYRLVTRY